ncbi:MAG: Flavobacterium phage vB FspS morran9 [Bacteroidota bacterium]|jgi:hypothetical protein
MGASSETFLQLREQDIVTLYDATFTKKEAQKTGLQLAKQIIDGGEVSKHEALANLVRLNEVITNAITEIKESVSNEKVTVLGVEFTPMNGRVMYDFKDDEVWLSLNNKLKQREELLKVALKSDETIFDSEGCEVPKVNINYSKSSLTIKF